MSLESAVRHLRDAHVLTVAALADLDDTDAGWPAYENTTRARQHLAAAIEYLTERGTL